ncbi:MAG: hypothetical protein N3D72_02455, partial [Candidatus Methanomethyliaceae archaeon]|nr:hypothetical protein [Candidatus Methanomethyliaceae archaeon]
YNEISREYPNGTFYYVPLGIELPPVNDFYGWLHDRRHHGFENGVAQLVGRKEFIDFNSPNLEDLYLTSNPESINTYLSTDESWNLFKFIFGYGGKYGGADKQMDFHYYNIAFKPFGIPYQLMHYGEHHIDAPMRYAGGFDGGVAGLPDYLLKQLKEGRFGEVLIMPGNTIDPLGIGLEGVKKDLAYGMENQVEPNLKYSTSFLNLRGMKIFFFSGGRKG